MDAVRIRRLAKRIDVTLGGSISVRDVSTAYERLSEVLSAKLPIFINGEKVEQVDTAFMQLLTVFIDTAHNKNITVEWRDKPSQLLQDVAVRLGLQEVLGI